MKFPKPTRKRTPSGLIEVLRLLTVVLGAGCGYELGRTLENHGHGTVLGPFGGVGIGVIVGSGLGYVLGGVFGRTASSAAERTEVALREISADTLIAGGFGAFAGAVVAAACGWPLFLIPQRLVASALFGIVIVTSAYVGFRVGGAKRDDVLAVIGGRAGVSPRRQANAAVVKLLDTSVAVDARILDVVRAGFLHGRIVVIQPVLGELQRLADSSEPMRRARGRRGLDLLETIRREPNVDLEVIDDPHPDVDEVDAKLVRYCLDQDMALLTLDSNLAKVADLTGVRVMNLHTLSLALRPPVVVGEDVSVHLVKPGKESGQAVGYLDDGTMVVVERARPLVGREVDVRVTSVVLTSNGRLVFAHVSGAPAAAAQSSA
ncbi:MAG: TRAM domain-containing protein [Frankiaceae bacterium]|nr:TRAM domain-containing protein [Frankiaceae bacterium]MBV9871186.1 TRAM domain-containing protein [Frankiaceae bacterium]